MSREELDKLVDDLERHIELVEGFDGDNGPITLKIFELKALLEEVK
jgi:hypothetical protein